eukprot:2400238-Pyramimonas_sp.AAC.1
MKFPRLAIAASMVRGAHLGVNKLSTPLHLRGAGGLPSPPAALMSGSHREVLTHRAPQSAWV